ncbi:MAG: MFS transporter [Alphaproteobacteria bacterium]
MFKFDRSLAGEFRANWRLLLVALLCGLFAFAVPSAAVPFIIKETTGAFGWTREQASLIASAKYVTGACASLAAGRILDSTGARPLLIVTSCLAGTALTMFLFINDLPTYYLAGVLLGLATPSAIISLKVFVSRLFQFGQGTAVGVLMMSASLGTILVPLLATALIAAYGWRIAFSALSLGIWLIALPLLFFVFPKGSRSSGPATAAPPPPKKLSSIFLSRKLWILGFALLLSGIVDQGFLQHQPLIFADAGLSNKMIGATSSIVGVVSLFIRPLLGNVFDKYSNRGVGAAYIFLSLAAILALVLTSPIALLFFVLFRAIGTSTVLIDTAVLGKHTFGVTNLGFILGLFTGFLNVGYAIGPWLMGKFYDATGSYDQVSVLFAALAIVAALLVFFTRPDHWLQTIQGLSDSSPVRRTEALAHPIGKTGA